MMQGLERRGIFTDDVDRADFVARLATLAEAEAFMVYAWPLLPTPAPAGAHGAPAPGHGHAPPPHRVHGRVRSPAPPSQAPLPGSDKSILVEEAPYLLEPRGWSAATGLPRALILPDSG
jgi:hypothetical protein